MSRLWFNGRGRIILYALGGAIALMVAISIFLGTRELLGTGQSAERKPALTTQKQDAPKTPEKTAAEKAVSEPAEENTESTRGAAEEAAEEKAAEEKENKEEEATESIAREEAERQALLTAQLEAEQAAADQYAAEWAATREVQERQAAADQAAVLEQQAQEERAAHRVARRVARQQRQTTEQAAFGQATDPASLFPQALAPPSSTTFSLTIPKLGLYGIPVVDDTSEAGLSMGAGHLPGTGFPWIAGSNTYIAGHRLGYAGTPSDHVFYNLPLLVAGDEVILTDENGQTYTYVVSEIFEVSPYDLSVTAPVGRDVVTLQTCIENFGDYWTAGPNWLARYVVRAERTA